MSHEKLNDKHVPFYTILETASKSENPSESIKEAMKNDSRVLTVLGYALNPSFKFKLPEGIPPYIPSQHVLSVEPLEILKSASRLYIMCSTESKQFKREEMFIQWLEDMSPEEAELMIHIKDQTLPDAFENKITLDMYLNALGWDKEVYLRLKNPKI